MMCRSSNLVDIAAQRGPHAQVACGMNVPYRDASFVRSVEHRCSKCEYIEKRLCVYGVWAVTGIVMTHVDSCRMLQSVSLSFIISQVMYDDGRL